MEKADLDKESEPARETLDFIQEILEDAWGIEGPDLLKASGILLSKDNDSVLKAAYPDYAFFLSNSVILVDDPGILGFDNDGLERILVHKSGNMIISDIKKALWKDWKSSIRQNNPRIVLPFALKNARLDNLLENYTIHDVYKMVWAVGRFMYYQVQYRKYYKFPGEIDTQGMSWIDLYMFINQYRNMYNFDVDNDMYNSYMLFIKQHIIQRGMFLKEKLEKPKEGKAYNLLLRNFLLGLFLSYMILKFQKDDKRATDMLSRIELRISRREFYLSEGSKKMNDVLTFLKSLDETEFFLVKKISTFLSTHIKGLVPQDDLICNIISNV